MRQPQRIAAKGDRISVANTTDPVPHLTLDLAHGEVTEASGTAAVADSLPATGCRADRVQLAWYAPGGCRVLAEWPLT